MIAAVTAFVPGHLAAGKYRLQAAARAGGRTGKTLTVSLTVLGSG
jgi:hypothetical protein